MQLEMLPEARGLYLGLDTLNMRGGHGTNIEIGGSSQCDPSSDDIQWVFARNLRYGRKHLIYGLYELKEVYSTDAWVAVSDLCDYIFFLGYSGIVLAESFKRLDTARTLLPVWGFHDCVLFALGRKEKQRVHPNMQIIDTERDAAPDRLRELQVFELHRLARVSRLVSFSVREETMRSLTVPPDPSGILP